MFHLKVELVEDGLLGGVYESDPSIVYWGSWGAHRLAERATLATPATGNGAPQALLGPFALPAESLAVPVPGDARVWFKEVALTHRSGIPSIDAIDAKSVARSVLEGTDSVLLRALLDGRPLEVRLEQMMLEAQLAGEQSDATPEQIDAQALKGVLRVTPIFAASVTTARLRAAAQRLDAAAAATPLAYGSPAFQQAHLAQISATIGEAYSPLLFAASGGGPPAWPLGAETSIDKLHLPRYLGDQGSQPPVAFLLHDVETRDHPMGTDIHHYAAHYAFNDSSARFYHDLLLGAARREGLTPEEFVAAVTEQEAQPMSHTAVSDAYLRASAAVHEAGTYVANAMHYKSDMVWKHKVYYQHHLQEAGVAGGDSKAAMAANPARSSKHTGTAALVAMLRASASRLAGAPAAAALLEATTTTTATVPAAVAEPAATEMESFDTAPVQGFVNSGDCEDMSNMGSTVLRGIERVAAVPLARTTMPVLQAAARVMARRFVLDVAASVTAAFVNTEGKELGAEELKAFKDLPRIGSPEDARKKIGGHCHGLSQSRASVYDMLARAHGLARVNADLPKLAAEVKMSPAWTRALPTHVLEGTSSISSWVLPVGEVSPALGEAAQAQRNLVKAARASAPTLIDTFKTEGLCFYAQPAADSEQRRVSSFYLGLSHVMSPELYAQHPLYGQMAVVDAARRTRGLDVGAYLRASLPSHNTDAVAGLVPVFYSLGRARWEKDVRPVMAAIQNQMPLSRFARFTNSSNSSTGELAALNTFESVHVLQNHPMSLQGFAQLAATVPTGIAQTAALEAHAQHFAAESGTLLASRQLQPLGMGQGPAPQATTATTSLCFFSRPWRLALKPETAAKVEQELAALQQKGYIVQYRLVHDRPLAQADDVVTLEMALPVPGPGAPVPVPAAAHAPAATPTPSPAKVDKPVMSSSEGVSLARLATPFWERK